MRMWVSPTPQPLTRGHDMVGFDRLPPLSVTKHLQPEQPLICVQPTTFRQLLLSKETNFFLSLFHFSFLILRFHKKGAVKRRGRRRGGCFSMNYLLRVNSFGRSGLRSSLNDWALIALKWLSVGSQAASVFPAYAGFRSSKPYQQDMKLCMPNEKQGCSVQRM